jgi:hypothetical protein
MLSHRSTRHGVDADGSATPDEDSMVNVMRRKAATNLDSACMISSSKYFLAFSSPPIYAKMNNVGISLGNSFDSIFVLAKALKHMEFDRLKCTPVVPSKSGTYLIDDDDDEVYAI